MAVPLVDAEDLALYLNDSTLNASRAEAMIGDAQILCESVVSPLPVEAAVVVKRVALRAYVTTTQSRQAQMQAAGSPFGGAGRGVWLEPDDVTDLRNLASNAAGGSSGVISVDILPAGYVAPLSWGYSGDGDWYFT